VKNIVLHFHFSLNSSVFSMLLYFVYHPSMDMFKEWKRGDYHKKV